MFHVKQCNVKKILIKIWRVLFALNFALTLVILYIPLWFCFYVVKQNIWAHKIQVFWAKWLMLSMCINPKIRYAEKIKSPAIYVSNHTSALDIIVMYKVVNCYFHFVSKKEWASVPLFGILFKKSHIPLDRKSKTDSFKAMNRAMEDLKKGISIVIFPEGTMKYDLGKISNFKSGAFKLAVNSGFPIVPVVMYDNLRRLPYTYKVLYGEGGPGVLNIEVLNAIDPQKFENDYTKLKEFVFTLMSEKLKEYENANNR